MDIKAMITREVKERFKKAIGSHDWEHTQRVTILAKQIAEIENADLEVVQYAALLHDLARNEEDLSNGQVDHAQRSAELAREILNRYLIDKTKIPAILHCIETHRFRNNLPPKTLEAKVLFDADKLDAIGAVGIGRAFLFAGEVGARLHNRDIEIEKTQPYTEEDTAYREYLVKLSKVKDRILTAEGKRLAQERHEFMKIFFDRLNQEVTGQL